jgi:hypothetical protein
MSYFVSIQRINEDSEELNNKVYKLFDHPETEIPYTNWNIELRAINKDNMEEYDVTAFWSELMIHFIIEKLKNKEYTVKEFESEDIEIRFTNIVSFKLTKTIPIDLDVITKELVLMREEYEGLSLRLMLFRNFFFNNWNEWFREKINNDFDMKKMLWESKNGLYEQARWKGVVIQEYGSLSNYLSLKLEESKFNESNKKTGWEDFDNYSAYKRILELHRNELDIESDDMVQEESKISKNKQKTKGVKVLLKSQNGDMMEAKIWISNRKMIWTERPSVLIKIDQLVVPRKNYKLFIPKFFN